MVPYGIGGHACTIEAVYKLTLSPNPKHNPIAILPLPLPLPLTLAPCQFLHFYYDLYEDEDIGYRLVLALRVLRVRVIVRMATDGGRAVPHRSHGGTWGGYGALTI